MASRWIKNTSGSNSTYVGQLITDNSYYQIQDHELISWQNDSTLLTDIGSGDATVAKDDSGTQDITDVADGINYLKDINDAVDADGVPLSRTKITRTGWHFQGQSVEITTSTLNGFYNKDVNENDLGYVTVKGYDVSNTELTTQGDLDTNCVKSVITWEMSQDIEIIGGEFYQSSPPLTDTRIWVTAIPDLPTPNGSVPFLQGGHNLKLMGTGRIFSIDGRTPKHLPYDATYHTNKFEVTIRHAAGARHTLMFIPELFRENV